jgi:hypothetical protein
MRYDNNYQRYKLENQHEYFSHWNGLLRGPKYKTPGKILYEATKEMEKIEIGGGVAIDIEPENLDSTMVTFIKTGSKSMEWHGTAK